MVERGVLDQVLELGALDRDGLTSLGASTRIGTFAALIDRDPAAQAWLKQTASLDSREIATATDLVFRASLARGDFVRAAAVGGADGLAAVVRSACAQDWDGVIRHGEALSAEEKAYSEVLLLVGAARIYRLDGHRGEAMIEQAMTRLKADGDLRRASFWAAADLFSGDPAMLARITAFLEPVRPTPEPAPPATAITPAPPQARSSTPLLVKLFRRGRALTRRSPRRPVPAEVGDSGSVEVLRRAAEAAFAQGRTEHALSLQRQANALAGHDQPDRVFSAPIRGGENLRQDPTTVNLVTLPDAAWAAELRHAEVWGGEDPAVVLTAGRSVIVDGLRREPASVIGQPGAVLRARSGAGEVLVDLAGRPEPWRALEPTVLIGGAADDDAWLLDCLPKIEVWRRSGLGADTSARVMVHAHLTPRQAESLRRLGVASHNLVRANAHGTPRYDRLIVPSIASIGLAVDTLRAGSLGEIPPIGRDLVYLTRLDEAAPDELALIQALKRIGMAAVRPGDHAFPALALRLAAARAVAVAPTGPIAPLAFCTPGVPVIHLGGGDDRARAIADHIGLAYQVFDHGRGTGALLDRLAGLQDARP